MERDGGAIATADTTFSTRFDLRMTLTGALNLQVMEFGSKGGGNCKYWNMTVKATGWKLKVMHFVGLEFASSGN